nr:hypothetical protein [Tanacetum cinerariifolium]
MVDWLSNVETDKVIHTVEIDIVRLVDKTKSFGKSSDEFDKETGSSDGFLPKQADLSCVHASKKLHSYETHVVPSGRLSAPERITLSARVSIEKLQLVHYLTDLGPVVLPNHTYLNLSHQQGLSVVGSRRHYKLTLTKKEFEDNKRMERKEFEL